MAVDGTYNITIVTPMGDRPASLTLVSDGEALSGTFGGEQGEQPWDGGTVSGDDVTWSNEFSGAMGPMQLDFAGTIDGDAISGTVQFGSFGSGTFTGSRA
jgi:hypothetical protein